MFYWRVNTDIYYQISVVSKWSDNKKINAFGDVFGGDVEQVQTVWWIFWCIQNERWTLQLDNIKDELLEDIWEDFDSGGCL